MTALKIEKNQTSKLNLSKNNSNLTQISVGLGWDMAKSKKGGLFGSFFNNNDSIDLDASAIFLSGKNVDKIVYFGNLNAYSGAVKHSGDNLTGEGDGDDETITIQLSSLPKEIDNIFITINSYRGQKFTQVANAHCNIYDDMNKKKHLISFNLSASEPQTALIAGQLKRVGSDWEFKAVGKFCDGQTANSLASQVQSLI